MKAKYTFRLFLAVLVIGFSSCSPHLKYFETAQAAFNQAAEAENTLKLDPGAGIAISAESQYRIARTYIMKAMGDIKDKKETHDKTNLSKDGLLLNAYTIKGLSEWKLGMYQAALNTAGDCEMTFKNNASVQNQRDFVVMMCLEALVYNDSIEAYIRTLNEKTPRKELTAIDKDAMVNLMKAFKIINDQRSKLDDSHPVQRYLLISQLSIAKNWKNIMGKFTKQFREEGGDMALYNSQYKPEWAQQKEELNKNITTVLDIFQTTLEGGKENALYKSWEKAVK